MPFLVLSLIGLAIVLAITSGTKDTQTRNSKHRSILYGVLAAVLTFILLSASVYRFGYQAGAKAKTDNHNGGVATQHVEQN